MRTPVITKEVPSSIQLTSLNVKQTMELIDDKVPARLFQMVIEGEISGEMLQRYESVARRVPAEVRRPGLSWSAHAAVARLSVAQQRALMLQAEEEGWSSEVLRKKARQIAP